MRSALVLVPLLLGGCPKHGRGAETLDLVIEAVDRAWEARADGGLDPVAEALETGALLGPDDPRVSWRLARLWIARGLVAEDSGDARRAFATARGHADRCVRADPGVASLMDLGRAADAVARLDSARAPCATWLGMAWARWRRAVGPAGALDDVALGDWLTALPDDGLGFVWHARALAAEDRSPEEAGRAFDRAVTADPGEWVRAVDRLLWRQAAGETVTVPPMPRVLTPEEEAQFARLRGRPRGDGLRLR